MSLLDVVFPDACAGCGRPGSPCCVGCRQSLDGPARLAWPDPPPPGLPPPWAVAAYDDVVRSLLITYKERGAIGLSRVLARPLAAAVTAAIGAEPGPVLLVPVPAARQAVRERGDDVLLVVTRRAASQVRRAGHRVGVAPVLRHSRAVADSAGLDARARATNLAGAFAVVPRRASLLATARVVIVDDLITTGTTIAEVAQVVAATGAEVLGAATIAATRRQASTSRSTERSRSSVRLGDGSNGATVGATTAPRSV